MAKCELIRGCAKNWQGIINQINASNNQLERKTLGATLTDNIVKCLNSQGVLATREGSDVIDFGTTSGCRIKYDVIQNLSGPGKASIACTQILSGTCGSGSGSGYSSNGSSGGLDYSNSDQNVANLQQIFLDYGPWLVIGLLAYILFIGD